MSEWKEDANKRRDSRQRKEGPVLSGPRKGKKPSPKKRERLIPIWEVRDINPDRTKEVSVFVSAETADEARAKGEAVLKTPAGKVVRLHQKDRALFGDVLDTPTILTNTEIWKRWYPGLHI